MSEALFGTDGIRGPFGEYPLVRPTVSRLGRLLAARLGERPTVVLGGDTRASTPEICAWLAAGLAAGGATCRFAGVLPTPGVAFLTAALGADCGIAVSASHNPLPDNGIKLLDRDGFKWPVADESALEAELVAGDEPDHPTARLIQEDELRASYLDHLVAAAPSPRPLDRLRVVVDSANGAASAFAHNLFDRLGAKVSGLADSPDGTNINSGCGSTHPGAMAQRTVLEGADLGFSFDGDADRTIFADETGQVRDGDAILYLWARALAAQGELEPPAIVATSMSNLGLERALAASGIDLVRCSVGDRAVVETLRARGLMLGGEQSGHIVNLRQSSTGDGLRTALAVALAVAEAGRPASELLAGFQRFPQVLKNAHVDSKPELTSLPAVRAALAEAESELGDDGRIVLRYSGTEPLARVMIEGPEMELIDALADRILESILAEVGQGAG